MAYKMTNKADELLTSLANLSGATWTELSKMTVLSADGLSLDDAFEIVSSIRKVQYALDKHGRRMSKLHERLARPEGI